MRYGFVSDHEGEYSVEEMCEALELSRSGYYRWKGREPSSRGLEDERLKAAIAEVHGRSAGLYGHRPVHRHLLEEGLECGRDRTLRLMGELGLKGEQSPRYRPLGTDSAHGHGYSPNLLVAIDPESGRPERRRPERPDQVWVADTTYLRVGGRWMYLATVMDLCSRRIVGWSLSGRNDGELACQALLAASMARGGIPRGVVHHSDRGSAYACCAYRALLARLGMVQSMGAKGNCYDNAAMESFFGRFKVGSIRGTVFESEQELRSLVFEYIELFYNRFRKHSALGYLSPAAFEASFAPPPMGGSRKEETFTNN